ncbi:MAG TPA: N-acetyltransferase [Streptosporangiaceae bacterium]|jgi:hypothetical protein|nr:N-acetyltransferase [Streptosporangiaceae bacterium]
MSDNERRGEFVPDDFAVPLELVTGAFRLEPLGPQHNEGDYRAWMSSIEHIRSTPGFAGRSWPRPEMTPEENLGDLRRHAEDFAERRGFTYTVLDNASGEIVGCVYIYPPGDGGSASADVRSWVRSDRADLDAQVHDAVSGWLRAAWPFPAVDYAPR